MVGPRPDIEMGQDISVSNDGNVVVSSSFYAASIFEFDSTSRKWIDTMNFDRLMSSVGKGPYYTSLSGDGNVLAVGCPQGDIQGFETGDVQIFAKKENTNTWVQKGRTIFGENAGDAFGYSLDLSDYGEKIVIGAFGADYAKIFQYSAQTKRWKEIRFLNGKPTEGYGYSVAMSGDATTIIVGAPFANNSTGYARIINVEDFTFSHTMNGDVEEAQYGKSVAISKDGKTATLGAPSVGNVFVAMYDATSNTWKRKGYRISDDDMGFGSSLSISDDGNVLAVGAPLRSVAGRPIAGHAYIFQYSPGDENKPRGNWDQLGEDDLFLGGSSYDECGKSIAMSSNATTFMMSCPGSDIGRLDTGKVCAFKSPPPTTPAPQVVLTNAPTDEPSSFPTQPPTPLPTPLPTISPTPSPSQAPTPIPTTSPTNSPTPSPSRLPTRPPSDFPTKSSVMDPVISKSDDVEIVTKDAVHGGPKMTMIKSTLSMIGLVVVFLGGIGLGSIAI